MRYLILVCLMLLPAFSRGWAAPLSKSPQPNAAQSNALQSTSEKEIPPRIATALKDDAQRIYDVLIHNNLFYLSSTAGVLTMDAKDSRMKQKIKQKYLGMLPLGGTVSNVALMGENKLVIANGPNGLVVADISPGNEQAPKKISSIRLAGSAMGVFVVGRVALVASGTAGIQVVDLKDPLHPVKVDHVNTGGYARTVLSQGGWVYLADGPKGVQIFRLNIKKLKPVTTIPSKGHAFQMDLYQHFLLLADGPGGLRLLDVASPHTPKEISELKVKDAARGISVQGNRCAIADGIAGVALVDLKNPRSPKLTGRFKPERAVNKVLLQSNQIYAANDSDGLLILTAPANGDPSPEGTSSIEKN